MKTKNEEAIDIQSGELFFAACRYWLSIFSRALGGQLPGVAIMTILGFPWLVSHWIKIKLEPESHEEKVNPFIYTMQ